MGSRIVPNAGLATLNTIVFMLPDFPGHQNDQKVEPFLFSFGASFTVLDYQED
jgi:hypothetical protein